MKRREAIYLCNALDDATKAERKITTDSPAATNKVFGLCRALQSAGIDVAILSMGRGRQQGSFKRFTRTGFVLHGIKFYYAAFWDIPLLTHLVTACSLAGQLFRIRRPQEQLVLIAYNRFWHYMPALCIARLLRVPCYLDLEDGSVGHPGTTMSPSSLEAALDLVPDIKAVVVVHLYGQMADMPAILETAKRHDLAVIEDCAQAHGAMLDGRKAGTRGNFGCFSFYPTKNLGALGDGGAVVTGNAAAAEKLCALRQYGWDEARSSQLEGVNSRLDELQAAILRVRLRGLDGDNAKRRQIAAVYQTGLAGVANVGLPVLREGCEHVYHQFVIRCRRRTVLMDILKQEGIGCAIHYPEAAHQQSVYHNARFAPVPLSQTETLVEEILSLPMFPELPERDVERVVALITRTVAT